jgi:hypothetical protein
MVDEYANRLYKPSHFLIVVLGSVNAQGPMQPIFTCMLLSVPMWTSL